MLGRKTFKKEERLKSGKVIRQLFSAGDSFLVHPLKVNWLIRSEEGRYPARVLISVSRKNFRKASERNHLKRLIREAYRKNKYILHEFLMEKRLQCDFSLVFIGKEALAYSTLEEKIIKLLERLTREIENNSDKNNPTT
jgi:ribonuclease P protein component